MDRGRDRGRLLRRAPKRSRCWSSASGWWRCTSSTGCWRRSTRSRWPGSPGWRDWSPRPPSATSSRWCSSRAGAVLLTGSLALAQPRRHVTLAIAGTLLGVFWIGLGLAHAVLLRDLDHGDSLLFDVLLATFIGDTAAYFGGRLWGTRQLAPRVSPGKTVEGLLSGFLAGTARLLVRRPLPGLAVGRRRAPDRRLRGATAPLGDLFESMVKRDLEVKDIGRLLRRARRSARPPRRRAVHRDRWLLRGERAVVIGVESALTEGAERS